MDVPPPKKHKKECQVVFAGEAGSFTENAAIQYFSNSPLTTLKPVSSLAAIFSCIESGEAQYGVVPIENSYSGTIHAVFDYLLRSKLSIHGEIGVRENVCLVGTGSKSEVKSVRGHPHILEACSRYLEMLGRTNNLETGEVTRIPALNSALACIDLKTQPKSVAAIAPQEAATRYDLTVLDSGIANDSNVETRYLIIGCTKVEESGFNTSSLSSASSLEVVYKTSLVLAIPNQQGSIFNIISQFATRNINILKLETRPASTAMDGVYSTSPRHWDYLFYIDFEASKDPTTNTNLYSSLKEFSLWMRELGTYKATASGLEVEVPDWASISAISSC